MNALNCACPARLVARKLLIHQKKLKMKNSNQDKGTKGSYEEHLVWICLNCWIELCLSLIIIKESGWTVGFDHRFYSIHWSPNCLLFCRLFKAEQIIVRFLMDRQQAEKAYLYELMEILIFYAWLDIWVNIFSFFNILI